MAVHEVFGELPGHDEEVENFCGAERTHAFALMGSFERINHTADGVDNYYKQR